MCVCACVGGGGGGSKSCTELIFRKLCNLKGGPYISKVVRKFQYVSEIFVPGGPHISKYLDRGGTILGGGGRIYHDRPSLLVGFIRKGGDLRLRSNCTRCCLATQSKVHN